MFQCFGSFFKDCGCNSSRGDGYLDELMEEWNFCSDTRGKLRQQFYKGLDVAESFEKMFKEFVISLENNAFSSDIMFAFVALAYQNEELSFVTQEKLLYIATMLNKKEQLPVVLKLFEAVREAERLKNQKQEWRYNNYTEQKSQGKQLRNTDSDSIAVYYGILGITPDATAVDIKKAWRKKVYEFHPDKVRGRGLSEDFVSYATERMKKVNDAYEQICKKREIK